ncbi:tol-pal system protein YbgF [Roseobacter sp.]|uniref:tol-pal system protein YbgF n=1 Tax=Roseobacter sp. TaxID=1907202 RepID=UPI0029673E13|nr:tol-pal system protein YbgF [Roseobacter sp.]MDW3183687.1 tol-pal system protein YbgF [Roseobacter sp.]
MRNLVAIVTALALLPLSVAAQDDQTLADIRQEMTVLYVEIQKLRRELSTTGGASVNTGGASVLDRMTAIEAEMQRLTSKTEELEFRINRIVEDGTNRLGDLEFRLVELEGGDIAALGETSTLGGDIPATVAPAAPAPGTGTATALPEGGTQLAVGEEEDFKKAQAALAEGDFQQAVTLFENFSQTYPGGPLAAGADLGRGEALEGLGDTREAARAYLSSFSVAPTGPLAPQSLFRLGRSLGGLGQTQEACVTLGEVGLRFPTDPAAEQARAEMQRLGCA